MIRPAAAVLVTAALCATVMARLEADPTDVAAPILVTRDAYLMGTRAHLAVQAGTRREGLDRLEAALRVLEDTERELSTWRSDSAISWLNRHPPGEPWQAGPRTCAMLGDVFTWSAATDGAFDPGIGRLLDAWDIHGDGAVPDDRTLAVARASSGLRWFELDRDRCTITRTADAILDVGAFGKGEALDRVAALGSSRPWMIDLGGQVSVGGPVPTGGAWRIAVAHPRDRARPALDVRLTAGSLSTSGGSERDHIVGGARVAHHLDPRTGRPASFDGSVTVWHERALVADMLSTALYVMGPEDGLRWAEGRGLAAGYLIDDEQRVRLVATDAFSALIAPE